MHARHTAMLVMGLVLGCGDDGGNGSDSEGSSSSSTTTSTTTSTSSSSSSGSTTDDSTSSTSTDGASSTSGGSSSGSSSGSTGMAGTGCDSDTPQLGILTEEESALACEMSPLPELPDSPTNAFADDAAAATLGQQFYFESDWAGPLTEDNALGTAGTEGLVSCRVCHDTSTFASVDPLGVGAGQHPRHAPGSVNAALYGEAGYTWRGRFDVLWALPRAVFEAGVIFNSSRLRVAHVVHDQYQTEYDAVFSSTPLPNLDDETQFPPTGRPGDPAWDNMAAADQEAINIVVANVGKALEAYQRQLVSGESDFDRFVAGEETAMSAAAQRGFQLFVGKAGCVDCHSGAFFTDQSYRNLGLEPTDGDLGRFNVISAIASDPFNGAGDYSDDTVAGQAFLDDVETQTDDLMGRFRVPTVRDAARSAPYMHNGSIATLDDLIDFYDAGGNGTPNAQLAGERDALVVPLNLTDAEKADLRAFIYALDSTEIPAALTLDTSN